MGELCEREVVEIKMNKGIRLIKRLVALFLVLLLSIESFAALVSDNDGSAFITKAEFDSLKNTFQSQINQYNTTINSKIDGAIASYLAGIKLAKQSNLVDMIAAARATSLYNVRFKRWKTPQAAKEAIDVQAGLYINRQNGAMDKTRENLPNKVFGAAQLQNSQAWGGAYQYVRYTNYTGNVNNYTSAYYFAKFPFGTPDDTSYQTSGDVTNFVLSDVLRHRCLFSLLNFGATWSSNAQPKNDTLFVKAQNPIVTDYTSNVNTAHQPGIYQSNDIGTALGTTEWSSNKIIFHTWTDTSASDLQNNDFMNYCLSGNVTGNSVFVDYDYRDYYHTDGLHQVPIQRLQPQATAEGIKPGSWFPQWYYDASGTLHQLSDEYPNIGYYNNSYEFIFKWNTQKKYTLNWDHLTNSYYNGIFGEPFYKYQGIPICRTPTIVGKLKMKLQFDSSVHSGAVPAYTYQIMDCTFPNGAMPTTLKTGGKERVLKRETIPSTTGSSNLTTVNIEIEKDEIFDKSNGDYIYIKIEPSNADQIVGVEVLGSTIEYISE